MAMIAETIAKALGGRKVGAGWIARCPAHDDREPSLSIRVSGGKVLVRCHAGCAQRDVIAALKERRLWDGRTSHRVRQALYRRTPSPEPDHCHVERTKSALSIWRSAVPANSTPVETYLGGRGLSLPLSPPLRFHRGLKHPSGVFWPCMVALVTRGSDGSPLAIHRTFLARDGQNKAPIDPVKMMLGPCRGGAVRLAEPADVLMVGEGIETCLAAMQATGIPAWAALSTSGLRALKLPDAVRDVIILADGDDPGEAAARDAAVCWQSQGRRVRIARPPEGMDFNDLLTNDLKDRAS
jgi:hypothetical protein